MCNKEETIDNNDYDKIIIKIILIVIIILTFINCC